MKKYVSEFFVTFALVFAGITHAGIALTFGLVVLAMIYTFGDVSGGHLNPAATTAFPAACRPPWREVAPYVVAQILGALAAIPVCCAVREPGCCCPAPQNC